MNEIFPGIFVQEGKRKRLLTRNLTPGRKAFQEYLHTINGTEYREWNPTRSKLAAGIVKGAKLPAIGEGSTVLYLGAASGNTVSYISDILGPEGMVFAIEFSPKVTRHLVYLAETRPNIAPILADAKHPEKYLPFVLQSDFMFQDIAQREQVEIFLRNARLFLKKGGYCALALKARSIDVAELPKKLFIQAKAQLQKELIVHDMISLEPFEKDHALFVCQKK